jgi:prepilin-type N-terminal cleavage/methylation domain-containing protein
MRGPRRTRGFTLIELIVALALGVIILGAAIGYLIREMRNLTGGDIRQSLSRNGRYVGVSVRHDLQRAGVEIKSTTGFGTVAVWPGTSGDTLVVLYVPYTPNVAPPHPLVPPPGIDNPLPPGGTCGPRCVEVVKDPLVPLELEVGDLARLQVLETRRLILIAELVETSDTSVAITFTEIPAILRQPAGLEGELLLDRFGTFVQELTPIVYYLDDAEQLQRAARLNLDASPDGDVLAYGVERFDVSLVFADGDELEQADPWDEDESNDYDDVVAVRVAVTIKADRTDPRVNEGELLRRRFEWLISPRNLRYERNRL